MQQVPVQPALSCHKCGEPFVSNAAFCGHCGASAVQEEDLSDPYLGTVIDGAFRVDAKIGNGSMGVVYRATQLSLHKTVALKILRMAFITDKVVAERFRREALAASKLRHVNTINIIHFGTCPDGAPYIAMEYLHGVDMADLVAESYPLGTRRVVTLMSQVCLALSEAHAMNIIHRDLKPANIVVAEKREGEIVKVLDFGIAKIQETEGEGLTRDGLVCGTPAFMSPEQVSGAPVDPRSDLFSLGIILYYMLCGRLPFRGQTAVDMATAILLDDPKPPSKARIHAKVSPHIEAVCLKALSKEPVDRFQNAEEFRAALESAFLEHEAAGGDEALDAYSANSLDGDVVNSVDSATIAAHTPVPMPSVKANSRSKNKLILPLVVAAAVVLGIIVALLLTSGGEGAKETEETVKESSNESEANAGDETSGDGVGGTDPEKNGGIQPLETSPDPVDLNPDEAGNPSEKVGANDTTNDASKDPATDENPEKGDADDETRAAEEEVVDPVAEKKKSDRREAKKLLKEGLAADGSSAISKLKKAVKLDPRLWEAWEALGDAYLRKSNRKAAARAYKKVLKYKPSHRRKRVMEKVIESAN